MIHGLGIILKPWHKVREHIYGLSSLCIARTGRNIDAKWAV